MRPSLVAAACALGLMPPAAPAHAAVTELVSRPTAGGPANDESSMPSISADGRYVAFSSAANNLSQADDNSVTNVFVRDTELDQTILVSRAGGHGGAGADGRSWRPSVSADGRYVAYSSLADNLSSADQAGTEDIYLRDLRTGRTMLVSRRHGSDGEGANGDSASPVISGDGRYVAFDSDAENLSGSDAAGVRSDVFVRDVVLGRTTLASRRHGRGGEGADGESVRPSISADGRLVAFESSAPNLSRLDRDPEVDVFVRDLRDGRTLLASRQHGVDGAAAEGDSEEAAMSSDGRHVAFTSRAANLSRDDGDTPDVFLRDLLRGRTVLVSRRTGPDGAGGNELSSQPSVSADGRYVAFSSYAENLSSIDDYGSWADVFVRDTFLGRTSLVSVPRRRSVGYIDSWGPSISADGRQVAFFSYNNHLVADDENHRGDVFRRSLTAP